METKNDGGAAFPCHTNPRPGTLNDAPQGMTLRDYFAAKMMQFQLNQEIGPHKDYNYGNAASRAYVMADAMLEARKK